ncbi:MAG: eukaryotic-like serine/threonine-protein kinase [Candidatus Eremiobacteraeota bacterium]|jgi:serine/threonine-protein kinase|nr:eukaryotic-like serine/threonine-protein kinase [Candidatus Eremiobacteraeota bacterium]
MRQEQVLNNRYRVDGTLGNGGMALVYVGTDTLLRRRVAIKVLRDQFSSDDDFVKRFSFEAQSAAKLSHPNIVNIYDFGREDHAYYIVMELVDGTTLGDLLREGRALPEPVAVDYAIQIASGLAYAHRQGLMHRDVKPANILVTQDDVVKLSDFGIARAVSEHTLGVTQPGMVMGSVAYISPEQAQGHDIDERSDLYSVGVVLYQMLTGKLPFSGDNPVAVALKHVSEPPPPIDPKKAGVSPAVAAIVARLLRKDPRERFASATELASALREARERPQVAAAPDASFADAPTMRFSAVSAPKPPPRPSVAPDRPRDDAHRNGSGTGADVVEVHHERRFDPRWLLIPALLVVAIAVGFLVNRGPSAGGGGASAALAAPDLKGKSASQAQQLLQKLGLRATLTQEPSDKVPPDRVIRQDPAPGTKLAKDDAVALVVSSGLPKVQVPDIGGYSVADAQRALQTAKLKSKVTQAYSATVPAGQVIDVKPAVGASVRQGSTVALTVSQGVKPIGVPSIVSLSLDAARAKLKALGLNLSVGQQSESDTIPANTIVSQDPQSGTTIAPNGTVTAVVSSGSTAVPVPNVVGTDSDSAQKTLRDAGFVPSLTYDVEPANAPQNVTSQSPAAGSKAKKGSKATIIVAVPGSVPDVAGQPLDVAKAALVAAGYQIGNIVQSQEGEEGKVVRTEPEANANLRPGESVNITVHPAGQ